MQDLLKRRIINPGDVRQFVLDEADVMISQDNSMGSQVTSSLIHHLWSKI